MSLHQRGVRPMRTDDHLLERIVVQLHVAGRLHNEIGRLEHGDINDVQLSICRRGREEKSPLLAIVCVSLRARARSEMLGNAPCSRSEASVP